MEEDNLFVGVLWSLALWVLVGSALKLSGLCGLSWLTVLAPVWLPAVGFAALFAVTLLAYLVVTGGGSGQ